jgi:hypothetical protein
VQEKAGETDVCLLVISSDRKLCPNSSAQPKFIYTKRIVKHWALKVFAVFHELLNYFYKFCNKRNMENGFSQSDILPTQTFNAYK